MLGLGCILMTIQSDFLTFKCFMDSAQCSMQCSKSTALMTTSLACCDGAETIQLRNSGGVQCTTSLLSRIKQTTMPILRKCIGNCALASGGEGLSLQHHIATCRVVPIVSIDRREEKAEAQRTCSIHLTQTVMQLSAGLPGMQGVIAPNVPPGQGCPPGTAYGYAGGTPDIIGKSAVLYHASGGGRPGNTWRILPLMQGKPDTS